MSLDVLDLLRSALTDYRLRGAAGLQEAVERAVGKLPVHYVRGNRHSLPAQVDHLNRLLDLVIKFEALLARAMVYVPTLGEHLPRLLGSNLEREGNGCLALAGRKKL